MEAEQGHSQKSNEAVVLFVVYSVVIFGTMWLSGRLTNPSVYDRYLARFEGVTLSVRDVERAKAFYVNILSYVPVPSSNLALLLPDRRKLYLHVSDSAAPSEIVLRVRNGFPRLYDELKSRFPNQDQNKVPPGISEVSSHPWGDEFTLTDYDGNRFIYFRPLRRSSVRGE